MSKGTTAARAAAEWWAEQVGAPVFRQVSPEQRNHESDFTELALSMFAAKASVPDGAGVKFVKALEPRINKLLEHADWVSLSVDYGPEPPLWDAAKEAGIPPARFPIKTHTTVTRDYVTASLGYGARSVLVWSAPGWERPACGVQHYVNDEPRDEICTRPKFHAEEHGDWVPDPARCKACGGTYTQHHGRAMRDNPGRCHKWFEFN